MGFLRPVTYFLINRSTRDTEPLKTLDYVYVDLAAERCCEVERSLIDYRAI